MGTLDPTPHNDISRVSKLVDITGKTRPQVKIALDEWLGKGWRLLAIYQETTERRAVFVKDQS